MDSLPTGSIQSWLIVAVIALSPTIALLAADAVGRARRRRAPARPLRSEEKDRLAGSR